MPTAGSASALRSLAVSLSRCNTARSSATVACSAASCCVFAFTCKQSKAQCAIVRESLVKSPCCHGCTSTASRILLIGSAKLCVLVLVHVAGQVVSLVHSCQRHLLVGFQDLGAHAPQRSLQAADAEAAGGEGGLCCGQPLRLLHQLVVPSQDLTPQLILQQPQPILYS